ncbi:MAG: DotA/TraY family protein [Proteobacteria bacterium]|nr:DotA/TraY family protein [Pseudomonadota bacterium]
MNAAILRILFFFLLLFVPGIAMAAIFSVSPDDKSMEYLGMVFGSMGSLPIQSSGNPLVSQLIYIFNQIVFALAIIIIIVTTIIGTINTAQEGEALGKKMSSIWVPVRAGLGIFLLLPTVGGYNWIQITVMWLIIQGVGAANALWTQVLESNQTQGSIVADTSVADVQNAITPVNNIFNSVVCMQAINNLITTNPSIAADMGNDFITVNILPDNTGIQFGRANAPTEAPICGTVKIPPVGTNPMTMSGDPSDPVIQQRQQLWVDAILSAEQALEPAAAEAIMNPDRTTWQNATAWVSAARALNGAAQEITRSDKARNAATDIFAKAKVDGWIHAGNYYGQLVGMGKYAPPTVNVGYTGYDSTAMTTVLGPSNANPLIAQIVSLGKSYRKYVDDLQVMPPASVTAGGISPIPVSDPNPGGAAGGIVNAMLSGFFTDLAASLGAQMTTGCLSSSTDPEKQVGDPLQCMALFGNKLANAAEITFWTGIILIMGIWIGTAIYYCMIPTGPTMDKVLTIIIPIASVILMLVWAAGITLAIYVPLIPFLVFTFGAITWVILVIEAMLGAPLIALTLIIPSEDEIGKAGHAIVILLGLFLRPALMILGFVFAQKLLLVAVGMLNFGFAGTMRMSITGGIGPFAMVAIIVMYTGIATSLVHEAFSLIYVLPDKVLRWMGVAGEGGEAGQHVKELEASHEKGAAVGKGIMKGAMDKTSKSFSKKASSDEE